MCAINTKCFRKLFIKGSCHLYGTFIAKEEMFGFEDTIEQERKSAIGALGQTVKARDEVTTWLGTGNESLP